MKQYNPYAIDWRFLPDDMLYVKDFVRNKATISSNHLAKHHITRPIWINTVGIRILHSVQRANKLFIHIPKTGGTSTSRILYNRNLPHYTMSFWQDVYQCRIETLESFSIIRSPLHKMLSSYKMILGGGTDLMAYSRYWKRKFPDLRSFDRFVDYVYEKRHCLDELPLDLWEQTTFVADARGRVMVDRLFLLDERRGFSPELMDWLAVKTMPHLNATPRLATPVSEETCRKVAEIYRRDMQLHQCLLARQGYVEGAKGCLQIR